jgi:hypothetical protein
VLSGSAGVNFASPTVFADTGNVLTVIQTEPTVAANSIFLGANIWTVGSATASYTGAAGSTSYPSTQPLAWRLSYASTTQYLTSSALYDEGTVTSGMVPVLARRLPAMYMTGCNAAVATVGTLVAGVVAVDLPMTEAELTSMDSKVRVAPAKNGCYQPLYQSDGSFKWNTGAPVPPVIALVGNAATTTPSMLIIGPGVAATNTYSPGFLSDILSFINPANDVLSYGMVPYVQGANGNFPWSMGWADSMIGVTFYRGLDANSSLTIKAVSGYEIAPCPTSPIRQFVVPGGDYSPQAMQLYTELVAHLPHSYPASSNFLGSVLTAIGSLLPMLLPHVPAVIAAFRREPIRYASMTAEMPRPAIVSRPRSRVSRSRSRSISVSSVRRVRIARVPKKRKQKARALLARAR